MDHVNASQDSISKLSHISSRKPSQLSASQLSVRSLRHAYFSLFPMFLHDYIEDIIDMKFDENCAFLDIGDFLGWDEES